MGVRLAAITFDRSEALVISATLDAAGIPNWIYWFNTVWNDPAVALVYDGFQIVVAEESLSEAIAVLQEARANPCEEAEILVVRGSFLDRLAGPLVSFFFAGGAPFPIRQTSWRSSDNERKQLDG